MIYNLLSNLNLYLDHLLVNLLTLLILPLNSFIAFVIKYIFDWCFFPGFQCGLLQRFFATLLPSTVSK